MLQVKNISYLTANLSFRKGEGSPNIYEFVAGKHKRKRYIVIRKSKPIRIKFRPKIIQIPYACKRRSSDLTDTHSCVSSYI